MIDRVDVPHSAITTWSGFIYQGKVAIYHVLSLLKINGCNEFTLQLDSLEDFTILDGDGGIISLHQVKALKSQNYGSYVEAFNKLKGNSDKHGCVNAKFHIAREITNNTTEEISKTHFPIEIYNYDDESWCSVSEIDLKIEDKIKDLLITYFADDVTKQTDVYVSKARGYLDQIILRKVLEIHKIVHDNLMSDRVAAYEQTILFNEFLGVLHKDLDQDHLGEDYYYYILLNDFHRYYQEYCIDNEGLTDDELMKLSLCMKEIECIGKEEMIRFICNILPHRKFKFNSLMDYKENSFDKDGIQEAFLNILNELRQPELNQDCYFQWRVGANIFTPTAIDKGDYHASKVCGNIIKNSIDTDLDVMFEGCNLVTTSINVDSITAAVPELIRCTDLSGRDGERISRWKKVSLVSLSNVKEIIND